MYIIKNAWTSIIRNKGRNILIGIILIVISCAVSVTLAINNSSTNLINSYESKYEIEATIGINRENMMKNFDPSNKDESKEDMQNTFSTANNISIEEIENYADSKYVKSYYYTLSASVNSDTIEKASMTSNDDNDDNKNMKMPSENEKFDNLSSGDFTIKGYSSIDSMNEFIEGSYKITEGEVSEDFDSNDCIINSELATLNNLKIGDTIKLTDVDDEDITYKLTITGIFEEETNNDNKMSMFSNSVNTIITNSNFILKMQEKNSELSITKTPTFILTSKDVIEDFTKELEDKGLNEALTVETNLEQVENSTSTISNVKTFSTTFLIITLIIGTIVLLIINMINIRERKYEIGVLRTIGMKKRTVSLQFITELFIVSLVALLIGAGVGATISVPISNSLLENEITSTKEETQSIKENFGKTDNKDMIKTENFKGVANVEAFDSIDATVNLKVLLELLLIGLSLTLISSISAITSIQKFSPLTILKERS